MTTEYAAGPHTTPPRRETDRPGHTQRQLARLFVRVFYDRVEVQGLEHLAPAGPLPLRNGAALPIFPEGQSHSDPRPLPFKAGAARLALGARERGCEPTLIPVGLTFTRKGRFRGTVLVQFGEPVDITTSIDEAREDAPSAPDAMNEDGVRTLTSAMETAARRVTLNSEVIWGCLYLASLPLAASTALAVARERRRIRENLRAFFRVVTRGHVREMLMEHRGEIERDLSVLARRIRRDIRPDSRNRVDTLQ